jgi:siroheme synthase-like protein
MNDLFPIFLRLKGRRALVVGGGAIAAVRARQLLAAGARVTVVAPALSESFRELTSDESIELHTRTFVAEDIPPDCFIVIGATDDPATQQAVARESDRRGLLYNVVDDVEHCNFFTPSVVERGDLKIAISTNGRSPVLARRLRQHLESAIPESMDSWVQQLGVLRERLKFEIPVGFETRKRIIEDVIEKTIDYERN